jgi:DNA-binding MarR family transcriptional regulator
MSISRGSSAATLVGWLVADCDQAHGDVAIITDAGGDTIHRRILDLTVDTKAFTTSDVIGTALDRAADLTASHLNDRADLSASAVSTLGRLGRQGPLRLTALALREGNSQPSMTQLIQRLERQGLVSRRADPGDRRAALVSITDAGRKRIDERRRIRRARLAALLETLSIEERQALALSSKVALPIVRRLLDNAKFIVDPTKMQKLG